MTLIGMVHKRLLIRWINTLDIWDAEVRIDDLVEELKSGILLCNILKFHKPDLEFIGIDVKARSKKPCINNIEKGLEILF